MAGKRKSKPTSGDNPPHDPSTDTAELIEEVMDYLRQGYDPQAIASAMERPLEDVLRLRGKGLQAIFIAPAKETAQLEISRINLMLQTVMGKAAEGDAEAIKLTRSLYRDRARLELLLVPDLNTLFVPNGLLAITGIESFEQEKGGRPAHEPTPETCKMVDVLAAGGVPQATIAKIIGVAESTLKKYYQVVLDTARGRVIGRMSDLAITKAMNGEDRWLEFALSRIGGPDWAPRYGHGQSGTQNPFDEGVAGQTGPGSHQRTIRIIGGGPPPPTEFAVPPGQDEALAAIAKQNADEIDIDDHDHNSTDKPK